MDDVNGSLRGDAGGCQVDGVAEKLLKVPVFITHPLINEEFILTLISQILLPSTIALIKVEKHGFKTTFSLRR
jgi:hypothetical protein